MLKALEELNKTRGQGDQDRRRPQHRRVLRRQSRIGAALQLFGDRRFGERRRARRGPDQAIRPADPDHREHRPRMPRVWRCSRSISCASSAAPSRSRSSRCSATRASAVQREFQALFAAHSLMLATYRSGAFEQAAEAAEKARKVGAADRSARSTTSTRSGSPSCAKTRRRCRGTASSPRRRSSRAECLVRAPGVADSSLLSLRAPCPMLSRSTAARPSPSATRKPSPLLKGLLSQCAAPLLDLREEQVASVREVSRASRVGAEPLRQRAKDRARCRAARRSPSRRRCASRKAGGMTRRKRRSCAA